MLAAGVTAPGGVHTNQPSASAANLQKEMQDLRDRLVSTCVTGGGGPNLEYTTKWITLELPQDPDAALIFYDAVTLFHIIGTEFATTFEIHNQIYQNKKAGLSTLSLVLDSSFQNSL
jgi:hypothetical protein